ncbi:MAG TPA: hypothetical protein VF898_03350 [Chloroflexota bacterium]
MVIEIARVNPPQEQHDLADRQEYLPGHGNLSIRDITEEVVLESITSGVGKTTAVMSTLRLFAQRHLEV